MRSNEVQFFVRLAEILRNQGSINKDDSDGDGDKQMDNEEQQRRHHKEKLPVKGGHPHESDIRRLEAILRKLQYECIGYKFTVYRCAIKIVTLQKILMSKWRIWIIVTWSEGYE